MDSIDLNIFLRILQFTNCKSKYNPIDGATFLALRSVCKKFKEFSDSIEFWRNVYQPLLLRLGMENTQITTHSGVLENGITISGFMYFYHIYKNITNTPIILDTYDYHGTPGETILTSNGTLKITFNKFVNYATPYGVEVVTFSTHPPITLFITADGKLWETIRLPRFDNENPEIAETLDKFNSFNEPMQIEIPDLLLVLGVLVTGNMSLCITLMNDKTVALYAWLLFDCPLEHVIKRTPPLKIGNINMPEITNINITLRNDEIYVGEELLVDEETVINTIMANVYTNLYTDDMIQQIRNQIADV